MTAKVSESEIQQKIQIDAVQWGAQLLRNNSGALKDQTGRLVRYGLGNTSKQHNDQIKSSDLIGFTKVLITADMVGKTVAVFTAVEVKGSDWKPSPVDKREIAQRTFLQWILANGGLAGFAWDLASFRRILGR